MYKMPLFWKVFVVLLTLHTYLRLILELSSYALVNKLQEKIIRTSLPTVSWYRGPNPEDQKIENLRTQKMGQAKTTPLKAGCHYWGNSTKKYASALCVRIN